MTVSDGVLRQKTHRSNTIAGDKPSSNAYLLDWAGLRQLKILARYFNLIRLKR